MRKCLLQLALLAYAATAGADNEAIAQPEARESNWRLGAALGYGLRSNPLVQSDDIPIIVDLDIAWFGDRFFFDNGDIGLTFVSNDYVTASLVGRFNSDRVFFGKTETRFVNIDLAGAPLSENAEFKVPDRDYAIELGVELLSDGDWGHLQMSAFSDVSDTHNGYEIYINYGYGWRDQRWYIEPSFGLSYKSADLNNYYWGVRDAEAGLVSPSYTAEDGINSHARLMFSYQINKNWNLSLVAEFEHLNDEAAASPLVEDENLLGFFAGFGFRFR